ncbi:MAG TPA: DUF1638 domain-containing protein [Anaerolineae bacterium]|nr:DUF1638 domain-containing protein [Anaerolineae bacterium]
MERHKYLMIGCATMARECYYCAAISHNIVDVNTLEQGLHDVGEEMMSAALQRAIDEVDAQAYEAILLAYGLCNHGIRGLHAEIPLVIPRAHDCITLLLGSKEAYAQYFKENPGTFFHSPGWIERAKSSLSNPSSTTRQMGLRTYEEYVEQYGEENAKFLMSMLGDHLRNYKQVAYIDTGIPGSDLQKLEAMEWAQERSLDYTEIQGSVRLMLMLMNGEWDDADILVVEPGKAVATSYDDRIIRAI